MKRSSGLDLEAVETAIRQAALAAGARVLEDVLRCVGTGRRKEAVLCPRCATRMESRGVAPKTLVTLLDEVVFYRSRFVCAQCGAVRYPGDEALGVGHATRSPGLQRIMAHFGAKEPFKEVAQDLKLAAGIAVSPKDAERVSERMGEAMERWDAQQRRAARFAPPPAPETAKSIETLYIEFDGTGIPMAPNEVVGRKGKQKGGAAKTREARLGCVFTQTALDKDGRPVRDPGTTTYTGAIEDADAFGWRIYNEAVRRGLFEAKRVVVITDGAEWIRNRVQLHFPNAIHIIDLYHAKEHVHDLAKLLFDRCPQRILDYRDRWWAFLEQGQIESILHEARDALPREGPLRADALSHVRYLENNKDRMRYEWFKAQGLFIGSGVVEAACKNIIGKRLKQSGMEWTVRGANAILALRCTKLSNREEDFWEQRTA